MKTGQCDWCGRATIVYPAILGDSWSMLIKDAWLCSSCRNDVEYQLSRRFNERLHISMRGQRKQSGGYQEFTFDMMET